jgi:endonuclease/exonuclease/phosphatase family metal-dependent hydrolase
MGYATYFALSDDVDGRKDQHYLALLIRRRLDHQVKPIYLGTRNALTVTVGSLLVVLVHFDDRLEATRRVQARQLQYCINDLRNQGFVTNEVVMGDFNATYPTPLGRVVNAAAQCWEWLGLPSHEPDDPDRTWLGRRGGLLTRLGGMMTSEALQTFEDMDFTDADSRSQATMPSAFPIAQLDHVLVRGVKVYSFELNEFADSDHLALDVVVEVEV